MVFYQTGIPLHSLERFFGQVAIEHHLSSERLVDALNNLIQRGLCDVEGLEHRGLLDGSHHVEASEELARV
jgi:hypothetical protein